MLFIGTQFSNLYTAVDTPARGRVVVCLVFVCLVFACKYVLGHSRVSASEPPVMPPPAIRTQADTKGINITWVIC